MRRQTAECGKSNRQRLLQTAPLLPRLRFTSRIPLKLACCSLLKTSASSLRMLMGGKGRLRGSLRGRSHQRCNFDITKTNSSLLLCLWVASATHQHPHPRENPCQHVAPNLQDTRLGWPFWLQRAFDHSTSRRMTADPLDDTLAQRRFPSRKLLRSCAKSGKPKIVQCCFFRR